MAHAAGGWGLSMDLCVLDACLKSQPDCVGRVVLSWIMTLDARTDMMVRLRSSVCTSRWVRQSLHLGWFMGASPQTRG